MNQEQTSSESTVPKESSVFSKLFNIFASPGEVFESIKTAPKKTALWVIPCIFAIVIGIVFTFVVFSDPNIQLQMRERMEKQLDKQIAEGKIPPERVEATREQMEKMTGGAMFRVFGSIGTIVYVVGSLLVVSLAFFLVGKFVFKVAVPYGKVMEVVGPSFMVNFVLGSIVTMLTVLAMGSLYATPGLALAIGEFNPENKVHLLLSSINIFTVWYLAVLSIGTGKLFNVQTGKAATWVVGLWIVFTLLTTFVISLPGR
jgi:hypothetical protein